jgi:hypothetical protein
MLPTILISFSTFYLIYNAVALPEIHGNQFSKITAYDKNKGWEGTN